MSMTAEDIDIDPEFRSLIPPPSEDERRQLEANLLADGCRDPIVLWRGVVLDGHNRLEICRRHEIAFEAAEVDLPDRDAAKVWIIHNQLGRRNLSDYARIELARQLEPLIAARARANQATSTGGANPQLLMNSTKAGDVAGAARPINTRAEIAHAAGVSEDTVRKAKIIAEEATEEVKQQLRQGEATIHGVYREMRPRMEPATVATTLVEDEPEAEADQEWGDAWEGAEPAEEAEPDEPRATEPIATTAAHVPAPEIDEGDEEEAPEPFTLGSDKPAQPVMEDPEVFSERWLKFFDRVNLFLVSLPRRGGIVNLTASWSANRKANAIELLKTIERTAREAAAELKEASR